MEKIGLTVDMQTFNTIIAGLDELPHRISRPVIDKLIEQAQPQLNKQQEVPAGPLSDKVIQ
jgi:hypothetical protein